MSDLPELTSQRPTSITIVCVLGFIGLVALPIVAMTTSGFELLPGWYRLGLLPVSAIAGAASLWGLWKMKRWGAIAYLVLAVVGNVVMLATDLWNARGLIGPAIVLGVAFANWSKLR